MKILETCLYSEDLGSARDFYTRILGLEEISFDPARDLFLKLEDSVLIIFKASKTKIHDAAVPPHGTVGNGHLAFSATEPELEHWRKVLTEHGIAIVQEIAWGNGAKSIYFEDPAGNVLEFATRNLWFRNEAV